MRPAALIVEDDPNARALMKSLIEAEGFTVETAVDGAAAIDCLTRRDYAVILLDIVLPKVSGTGVMDHLRKTKPSDLGKVIVVTGIDVKDIQRLYPVCHAVGKPVMPSRLRPWVRKCLLDSQRKGLA